MNDSDEDPLRQRIAKHLGPLAQSVPPGKHLWHYTDRSAFLGILDKKQIWATDFRFLNDSQEVRLGEQEIYEVVAELRAPRGGGKWTGMLRGLWDRYAAFRDWAAPTARLLSVTVASFSEEQDDLSQWRTYGVGARGCGLSIGLDFGDCREWEESSGAVLVPCDYGRDHFKQDVANSFWRIDELHGTLLEEREFPPEEVREALLQRAHQKGVILSVQRKHEGFGLEKEWRVVTIEAGMDRIDRRPARHGGVPIPFVKVGLPLHDGRVNLVGVRVGPSLDVIERVADARLALAAEGYDLDKINKATASTIPYRPPLGESG